PPRPDAFHPVTSPHNLHSPRSPVVASGTESKGPRSVAHAAVPSIRMLPVLTPAEMAACDAAAIAGGVSEATLVDRAGRAVAAGARRLLGGAYGRRVVIVCGKGNNGADGRVAGERLAAWGARVDRFEVARIVRPALDRALGRADLAVDAMFGTGFRGPLEGDAAWVAAALTGAG